MQCGECRFWYQGDSQCRRYAPQPQAVNGKSEHHSSAHWPEVAAEDWCGEFQPAAMSPSDMIQRRGGEASQARHGH